MRSICSVDGCDKAVRARGLCHGHWQRAQRPSNGGDPGEADFGRQWRKWTPAEDAALLDLGPRCERGEVQDLAVHLERTLGACYRRRHKLRREGELRD